jgi:hypothetical protein
MHKAKTNKKEVNIIVPYRYFSDKKTGTYRSNMTTITSHNWKNRGSNSRLT